MVRPARVLAALLLAFAASVLLASPAAADVDDFTFDRMEADYTLERAADGSSRMTVVETLVARFPDTDQNRGIRRLIPVEYNGQPMNPEIVSVTDETGAPRPFETEEDGDALGVVSAGDGYVHGVQTYVITYTAENVTWDFPDTGLEFNWDVNGVQWAQPFGEVTARLHLTADLAEQLTGDMACYRGPQGATEPCDGIVSDAAGDGVVIEARAAGLAPSQTLTLAVGFEDGAFTVFDTSYAASPWSWAQVVAALGSLVALIGAIVLRRGALADAPGRATIVAEYTAPRDVDALEAAVLLGRPTKAIPAEVLEQAVVGSIRILEGEKKRWGGTPLVAELVDPQRADRDGRMLLDGLFPTGAPGDRYEFGTQDTRFSQAAGGILSAAGKDLLERGLRRRVSTWTRVWPLLLAALSLVGTFVFGLVAGETGVDSWLIFALIGVGVAGVAVVVAVVFRSPLTAAGAEARDHLRGLEEFIRWAEADRIRMLQSPGGAERVAVDTDDPRQMLHLYETLLPYAVVFGQEKQWSKQLVVLYAATGVTAPHWYVGTGAFDASSFAGGIGSLSAAATASSSTSGGSSGGGSAGGGGGGGGGGGV
ncbi:DUF2207 domain-containing protein [Microbacterium telephonicum]|uniref:Putative membrane protein DUF2207 n=1 Tax=Microbacterium telephonicum TaxID=1714841 RepID=A0A498CEB0_9MICO|nr:DUF2207 domain-containing protein [Microbacterium telephonicum]RLK52756.1 putative membrane protein DUF2207 [Microbacterium telephonicum]